ncbi:PA1136 family autoinducer-binding transcriptional regulator [Polymorphobacter sp. PAMC 29334]|uniref:PA1136 family autoinducer-binding transcriptional regulator n=1 Tax=Polymorphobacter sp. PAMC 29334 TaxID=2862331 RepID=UPI001D007E0A|nr:PA1136 family autoinducer-binding transcriptional regulator [Polymorphobacter sp. PAMC 29334]
MDGPLGGVTPAVIAIEQSADMDSLGETIRVFACRLGYDRFVLYTAPLSGNGPEAGIIDHLLWVEGDWFSGSKLDPKTYLARCPVNRHVLETDRPFFWTKTGEPGLDNYRVGHPSGPGLHGLQVPVYGPVGLVGAMSFGGLAIDSTIEAQLALTLVAVAAFNSAQRFSAPITPAAAMPRLSDRELEVMRWIASGRRQTDVALLLDLSERTVENHLRRIRNRLSAASTAQAVQLLVRAGELEP